MTVHPTRHCRWLLCLLASAIAEDASHAQAVRQTRYVDDYGAVGDGLTDDTRAIQEAISDGYDGVWSYASRIIFSPGKTYRVSRQIVVWAAVHLDTDADNPATILLAANTPGYDDPRHVRYVLMSRLSSARPDCADNPKPFPRDPNAYYRQKGRTFPGWPWTWPDDYDSARYDQYKVHPGYHAGNNFWSQVRHLRFRVEPGNPGAGVIHYLNAQGSFLYDLRFDLADAMWGVSGGPQLIDCTFRGGRYGLHDPPIMEHGFILNCRFEGQAEAAYFQAASPSRCWVGTSFRDVPTALQLRQPRSLVMIGCETENVGVGVSLESPDTRVLIQDLRAVHTQTLYRAPRHVLPGRSNGTVVLPTFVQGQAVVEGAWEEAGGVFPTTTEIPTFNSMPTQFDVGRGANVADFGAVGDGEADDTEAFRRAVAASDVVYLPTGRYRLSDTVMLRRNTKLVGEHALGSVITMAPKTPGFTDATEPKPVLDTPDDPSGAVHLTQLTMRMATYGFDGNSGCIGLRWRVGRRSSISNCNFHLGATGILVTGHGGGTFFNLWTAVNQGGKGLAVVGNREPLVIFSLSSEHQLDKAIHCVGARDVTLCFVGGGEGTYPQEKTMNTFEDCDRIAWIHAFAHPTDDAQDGDTMTVLRVKNTPNIWVGPLQRIHGEPVLHTLLDTRPDGSDTDLGNRSFVLYRWGELNTRTRYAGMADPTAWTATCPDVWLVRRMAGADELRDVLQGNLRPGATNGREPWNAQLVSDGLLTVGPGDGGSAYLHVYFMNPVSQEARLTCESPASLTCWVDGVEVAMGPEEDRRRVDLQLRQGWRRLLVRLEDGGKGTTLRSVLTGLDGKSPTRGRFQAEAPPVTNPWYVKAKAVGSRVQLSWQRPQDCGVTRVRVVRSDQGYPADSRGGTVVYEGPDPSFVDAVERTRGSVFYGLYTLDRSGAVSSGVLRRVDLGEAPFITDWLAYGPLDAPKPESGVAKRPTGYGIAYIEETGVAPEPGSVSSGMSWRQVTPEQMRDGCVDLLAMYRTAANPGHHQVAYLHTYVHASEATTCSLLVGSDDGFKVWVNGALVGGEDRYGVVMADNFRVPVSLAGGWNRILVKVTQGTGDWQLIARLAEPDGSLVKTPLRTAVAPDDGDE